MEKLLQEKGTFKYIKSVNYIQDGSRGKGTKVTPHIPWSGKQQ